MGFIVSDFIELCKDLFTNRIWTLDSSRMSKAKKRSVRFIKLVRITVDTFAENRMGFQCVSLSYFITLAVIPFAAVLFAVTGGLGLTDKLMPILYSLSLQPDVIDMLVDKSTNIINVAKSGTVGLVSALMFLWTILWLMFQVERVFNNVWGIRKVPRKIYKRFSFYILVIILSPFLVLLFGTGIAAYSNITKLIGIDLGDLNFLPKLLAWAAFYIVTSMTLSVMYKFIPAAKVIYKYALKSGFIAGLVFTGFQYLYLETQVFVTRLNNVYGAIAAIPLFLIWLNFSWQIIIYGAELTYSYQNVDSYHIPEWEPEENK